MTTPKKDMYIVIYCEEDTSHDVATNEKKLIEILDRYVRKSNPICMDARDVVRYLEDTKVIRIYTLQGKKHAESCPATELVQAVPNNWQLRLTK